MPPILEDAVKKIMATGKSRAAAFAIATASLQKAGDLKPGTREATPKGLRLGMMTEAQRKALRSKSSRK